MAKPRIGDVMEIRTTKGFAYAQYTHKHRMLGALLRVFGSLHDSGASDLVQVVSEAPAFFCFFPLTAAIGMGIVKVVGNVPLSPEAQVFPLFRTGIPDRSTKKVDVWRLWDGERSWPVGRLTAEQRKLSMCEGWNDTLLIERLESGWRPENDPE
jgi:hypothetical protein